jgi:transketolase
MSLDADKLKELKEIARTLRQDILKMLTRAGSGHPGGSLSAVELVASLYFHHMRYDPGNPSWPERDRFILSKGHAAPVLYATLARAGYFPVAELDTLRTLNSRLQGHPDMLKLPGIEISTGSLGQGLSAGNGMALAGKLDGKDYRVYVLVGCGEIQEGQVWEAAMAAAHYKLDNLCALMDYNKIQIDGYNPEVMSIEPVVDKWRAFGWQVIELNGHDFPAIIEALEAAGNVKGKPTAIIAHTTKGKGVSFMEGKVKYHGTAPTNEELEKALAELGHG